MDRSAPAIFSIAAHRGFADALVAGLVPRFSEPGLGLARLILLVPSTRAARTITEAFTRQLGERQDESTGQASASAKFGMLLPRMVTVGDLDLDEALGHVLDPLGSAGIAPAVEPIRRWLELARLIEIELKEEGARPLAAPARMKLAREIARAMDRLLVEEKTPADLTSEAILDAMQDVSSHWQNSIRLFARVQQRWLARLEERGEIDAGTRRNLLFDRARERWRTQPPQSPIIAAGVTSAAPALARLLRTISQLPKGAVILPDLDLAMSEAAWDELGRAGAANEPGGDIFGRRDALTHPQYHLKLLLSRMGIARQEVRPWHRRGMAAAPPARSRAISSLFLPPEASRAWVDLKPQERRLAGVRLMTNATNEEEAQAIALLVREALETPGKRVSVISADRALTRRVIQHLARWNIIADDTAGKPLGLTPAGRLAALLAELGAQGPRPVTLIATLGHPLVKASDPAVRAAWLARLRQFEKALRGPEPSADFGPLAAIATRAGLTEWFSEIEDLLAPISQLGDEVMLGDAIERLVACAEALAGTRIWEQADGRALSALLDNLRFHASELGTTLAVRDLARVLRDAMEEVAVRPAYGGHPRVAIYGLLESRMTRSDLVICAGLNEGSWPQVPAADALIAPPILRRLGVPGAEFRIGLAAHDLAGAMGAPEVILSRAERDAGGPTRPSRFLLRVEALLGKALAKDHRETATPSILQLLDRAPAPVPPARRPRPDPSPELRTVDISATALDRLLGDPYQFYAQKILRLEKLQPLAADPFSDPALRGTLMHDILDKWHQARPSEPGLRLVPFAEAELLKTNPHPLFWGLWRPRLMAALSRFELWIDEARRAGREVLASEIWGEMNHRGVRIFGKADRIDRHCDGSLGIIDYKTGGPPSPAQVENGFALQLGVLGLIAREGCFKGPKGEIAGLASSFEYWSFGRAKKEGGFGYREEPLRKDTRKSGLTPEQFLPEHERYLDQAITRYILGRDPFIAKENPDYPGYSDYDQLMRLEEWAFEGAGQNDAAATHARGEPG